MIVDKGRRCVSALNRRASVNRALSQTVTGHSSSRRYRLEDQPEVRSASEPVAVALRKRSATPARRGWLAPALSTGPTTFAARCRGAAGPAPATAADPAGDPEPAVLQAVLGGAESHQAADRAELSAAGALRRPHVLPLQRQLRGAPATRAAINIGRF